MINLYRHVFERFPHLQNHLQQLIHENGELREMCLDFEEMAHFIESAAKLETAGSNDLAACHKVLEDLAAEIQEFVNDAAALPQDLPEK